MSMCTFVAVSQAGVCFCQVETVLNVLMSQTSVRVDESHQVECDDMWPLRTKSTNLLWLL